jgi:Predicted phosphatase homologous to the C-terminal domain of histone macroH2A1
MWIGLHLLERFIDMITVALGDITCIPSQAIVNSANPSLLAGAGVSGAIHKAAGPQLEQACREMGAVKAGQAVMTAAFDLPAEFVIHAVAPRYLDGRRGEGAILADTYTAICKLVAEHGITRVTIPSIGTGIYRFPLGLAAEIAVRTLRDNLEDRCDATFVCFDQATYAAYKEQLG